MPGANKNEADVEKLLHDFLETAADDPGFLGELVLGFREVGVRTFEEAGVLGHDRGLVLHLPTGEEFQVTIRRSR